MIIKYHYTGTEPSGGTFRGIVHGSGRTETVCALDARQRLRPAEFATIELEPQSAEPGNLDVADAYELARRVLLEVAA
ncbi:MAG: hypothetical protein P8J87_14385 [Verrucomicrobiales bacterium]|nr:hypothetical protein [Verrucomicrobiales bacterium]